jgi:hypothetical protein
MTYNNVTPTQIAAFKAKAAADPNTVVTELPDGTFSIHSHGITITAAYAPASQVLTVNAGFLFRGAVDKEVKAALDGRIG